MYEVFQDALLDFNESNLPAVSHDTAYFFIEVTSLWKQSWLSLIDKRMLVALFDKVASIKEIGSLRFRQVKVGLPLDLYLVIVRCFFIV